LTKKRLIYNNKTLTLFRTIREILHKESYMQPVPINKTLVKNKPKNSMINLYSYKVPNIVIVGDKEIRLKIQNIESRFNILLIFSEVDELEKYVNKKTIAIIVDEKKIKFKLKLYLEALLEFYTLLPIFYLSRELKRPNFYASLYQQGLHGVIQWPKEANILHDLLIESLRPHPKAVGKSKGDEKLSDMVKSHLVLHGNYKAINVKVIEGFVFLEGKVKSLQDKEFIRLESSKVLGVKKVISKDIGIRAPKVLKEKDLERKIKMYIENVLGNLKRTISVKVENNSVVLSGAASTQTNILDIENFISKQAGVQKIIKNIKYAPSIVSKNTKKAKLLEVKIKSLFTGAKYISITIFGEFAEVSGTVKTLADRALVERYILEILAIKKVINKLFVSDN
jgi:osmotically-inducible protein OsmY